MIPLWLKDDTSPKRDDTSLGVRQGTQMLWDLTQVRTPPLEESLASANLS